MIPFRNTSPGPSSEKEKDLVSRIRILEKKILNYTSQEEQWIKEKKELEGKILQLQLQLQSIRKKEVQGETSKEKELESKILLLEQTKNHLNDKVRSLEKTIVDLQSKLNLSPYGADGGFGYRQTLTIGHSIIFMSNIIKQKPENNFIDEMKKLQCSESSIHIDCILDDLKKWYKSWKFGDMTVLNKFELTEDEVFAIAAYTHDLGLSYEREENLYFQLNEVLRTRSNSKLMYWKGLLYYILSALEKIQSEEITLFRGIPVSHLDDVKKEYRKGRPIHWSGFSSSTSKKEVAKQFARSGGIIFEIETYTAKAINNYSFIPKEDELVFSPNMQFKVVKEVEFDESDGYYYLVLKEKQKMYAH